METSADDVKAIVELNGIRQTVSAKGVFVLLH
jgi:hypothetical protein